MSYVFKKTKKSMIRRDCVSCKLQACCCKASSCDLCCIDLLYAYGIHNYLMRLYKMENSNAMEEGNSGGISAATNIHMFRKPKRKIAHNTPMEIFHLSLAVLSVGTSVAGISIRVVEGAASTITIVAGVLTAAIGPYAYYQQRKLTDIVALKDTYNAIGREVGLLSAENQRLHDEMEHLKQSVDKLEDTETALDVITDTQGHSLQRVANHVKESKEILVQMEKNLKATVLQNLLQVVINHDRDNDMKIEENEIDNLIRRIKMINGVDVVEEEFRELVLKAGGSLSAIMDIIKNSMTDEDDADELRSSVFILKSSVTESFSGKKND